MSSSCVNTSDNFYKDCPARMADARNFTDWRSSCTMNNLVKANNSVSNSFEYRMFLTRNASTISNINESYAEKRNACPGFTASLVPEKSILRCTPEGCEVDVVDPNGIGQGRDFGVGADCDTLANVSNLRNRVYKKTDSEENCCGVSWQSKGGYPYIENNLTISPRTPIGGL
jgi:hypothetical protein